MTETTHAIVGGCLCGAVRFSYAGPLAGSLGAITVCHCSQCRRAQGFVCGVVPALADGFRVTAGAELVREFQSSPGKFRAFCGACGAPLYSRRDSKPEAIRLRIGSLEGLPETLIVEAHTFTEGAPAWSWPDSAPRYPGAEPGRD